MTHTPGPWSMGVDGNSRVYGPDCMGEHSGLIANVFKSRDNARAISAVPDMIAALEAFITYYPSGGDWKRVSTWAAARAALDKATGETP